MTDEQKSKCHKIAEHYGEEHQMLKAVEEMAELTKEIMKIITERYETVFYANALPDEFYSELADVSIMIEQLRYLSIEKDKTLDKTAMHIRMKLDRQLKRMEEESNG